MGKPEVTTIEVILQSKVSIFTLGNGQKQDITINLHSFTETDGLAFKKIQGDCEELLDVLAAVETDHCDVDTFLLVLVQSVHNK